MDVHPPKNGMKIGIDPYPDVQLGAIWLDRWGWFRMVQALLGLGEKSFVRSSSWFNGYRCMQICHSLLYPFVSDQIKAYEIWNFYRTPDSKQPKYHMPLRWLRWLRWLRRLERSEPSLPPKAAAASCEVSGNDWPQLPIQQHPNALYTRSLHKELTNFAMERSTIFNGKIHYFYGHFPLLCYKFVVEAGCSLSGLFGPFWG